VKVGAFETMQYWCLGSNYFGQLGLETSNGDYNTQVYIPVAFGRGAADTRDVQSISCGSTYTVVVKKNGGIFVAGSLNGVVFPLLSPVVVSYSLKCTKVSCGRKHILALMESGFVLSWGMGYFGQLGHGDDSSWEQPRLVHALKPNELGAAVIDVACGFHHSGALCGDGRVFMFGKNSSHQCGTGIKNDSISSPRPVDLRNLLSATKIVCGRNHSAAVNRKGGVYTWGASGFGRLGLVDTPKNVPLPTEVPIFSRYPVKDIATGDFHMLALCVNNAVYSWGCGKY
jgi:alpha-tubulin suppressor-like RCC1 family protein